MALWIDRGAFRQFWPVHVLFFVEILIYTLAAGGVVYAELSSGLDDQTAEYVRFLGGQRLVFFLPVIIGICLRKPFARTLWLLLAWLYGFTPTDETALLALLLGYAVLVTVVLVAFPAGRAFFRENDAETGPEDANLAAFQTETPARALLRRRTKSVVIAEAAKAVYLRRSMHVFWACGVFAAWHASWSGQVSLDLLFVVFAVFLLRRRAVGKRRIFFPSVSSGRR